MNFAKQIEYNRRLLVEDIFRRLEAALQPVVDALNDFFAVLFSRRLPADWREQWHAFIAEQEAAGYRIEPQCVREFEDWIEAWARYCELLPVAETQAVSVAPAAPEQPPVVRRALPRPTQTQIREQFFDQKLADAQASLDAIQQLLDEFGRRLDAAKLDETVDAEAEVDRCEALIWRYHDALESARAAWLRDDLSGEADARLAKLLSPSKFGLPRITDEQQDQRAMRQHMQMNARSHGRDKTMDRVVFGMEAVEWMGYGAGIAAGGGVLYTAAKKGGKWAVVKALTVAAAAAAAEQGVEAGLRAAGADEQTIRGARLAAAVIAFIILRRKNRAAAAESPPPPPQTPSRPAIAQPRPQSATPKTASEPSVASRTRGAARHPQQSESPGTPSTQNRSRSDPEGTTRSKPTDPNSLPKPAADVTQISPGIIRGDNPTRITFRGTEVRAVRNLSHVDERTLRAMQQKGFAARDQNGQSLQLHHLNQNPAGPLVEIPETRHGIGNIIQHPLGNKPKVGLTPEQRKTFDQFRFDYWKARATEELQRRGVL